MRAFNKLGSNKYKWKNVQDFSLFRGGVLLCSCGWLTAHCANEAGLKFVVITPPPPELGL